MIGLESQFDLLKTGYTVLQYSSICKANADALVVPLYNKHLSHFGGSLKLNFASFDELILYFFNMMNLPATALYKS